MGRSKQSGVYPSNKGYEVDCRYRGRRIRRRGFKSHAEAADYLTAQKQLIKLEDEQGEQYVRPLITLEQAASRLIKHKSDLGLPSVETDEYLLVPVIEKLGSLTIDRICDDTLKPFIKSRLALGRKTKTINDALAVIRRICVLAATEWQLPNKLFWLESVPKITMLIRNDQRPPRPISWAEQKRLLDNLAIHIADMALFALNTGVRSNVVCQLRWDWEVKIKLDTKLVSVFVVPRQYVKGRKRERIIICNSIAQMCVDSQRGRHEEFVFTYYKQVKDSSKTIPIYKPISRMHNTAWVSGCKRARLDGLHVHDLRHTVGMRLRSAGINERTQDEILWHSKYDMNSHYAVAQVREIYNALESIKMEGQFEESINLLALVRRTQMKSLPQSYPTHKKTA